METFFDHNPTPLEIENLIGTLSKKDYLDSLIYCPKGENLLFIALLYERRGDNISFEKYKSKIPELYEQWLLGQDYEAMPIID